MSSPARCQSSSVRTAKACLRSYGRGLARPAAFQAGLADQLGKRLAELPAAHPPSSGGDEERRGRGSGEMSITQAGVLAQRADRAVVERYLALLVLLARADVQHTVAEVDVLAIARERLPRAYPGDSQQPDQRRMTRGVQRRPELSCSCQQRRDLGVCVDVGRDPRATPGQQVRGRDLASGVDRRQVAREPASHPEA
jgi:hypothetical protein